MIEITEEKSMRLSNVPYEKWLKCTELLEQKGVWYVTSDCEEGYNVIDCLGDSPFPSLVESEILNESQAKQIEDKRLDSLLIVF